MLMKFYTKFAYAEL